MKSTFITCGTFVKKTFYLYNNNSEFKFKPNWLHNNEIAENCEQFKFKFINLDLVSTLKLQKLK